MPFKSEAQRRLLWAKHPEIAERWSKEYPESTTGLPEHVAPKKKKKKNDAYERGAKKAAAFYGLCHD